MPGVGVSRGLASLIVLGFAVVTTVASPERPPYATSVGGSQHTRLADGSEVDLNTNTEIQVIRGAARAITLSKGEAHFRVAHDPAHPFVVTAGQVSVRALGTAFTVRVYDAQRVSVLMTEGRTEINPVPSTPHRLRALLGAEPKIDPKPRIVSAGQLAMVSSEGISVHALPRADIEHREAWRRGRLVFTKTPLCEAVAELNRYNFTQVVIADSAIQHAPINGVFRNADLEGFVAAVSSVSGFRVSRSRPTAGRGERIYLYGKPRDRQVISRSTPADLQS